MGHTEEALLENTEYDISCHAAKKTNYVSVKGWDHDVGININIFDGCIYNV